MANDCSTPEKCLFAGCSGECHPPLAAFTPVDPRIIAQQLTFDAMWRQPACAAHKFRDTLAARRLLLAQS
jgi:hypothetical protein